MNTEGEGLSLDQRITLVNIFRESFIDSLKATSYKVELYSKEYTHGRLVVVFGSPKKEELDEFVSKMKKDLLINPILVSGDIIMQYIQIIIPRGSGNTARGLVSAFRYFEEDVSDTLKGLLLGNMTDVNFLDNITAPFIDYYENGMISINDIVNEIKSEGCIYCINSYNTTVYNYPGYLRTVGIRVDNSSIVKIIEERKDAISKLKEAVEAAEERNRYFDGLSEVDLRRRIKYAKHPLERRQLEQQLAELVRNNGRHRHATKKKKKRK